MGGLRRPSYISVEEWGQAVKRLPSVRGKYQKCIRAMSEQERATTGRGMVAHAASDQFMMLEILLKMRQPKIGQPFMVKDGARLSQALRRLGEKLGIIEDA